MPTFGLVFSLLNTQAWFVEPSNHEPRVRFLLFLFLAWLSTLTGTGCTFAAFTANVRYLEDRPGTDRREIVKTLGQPTRSQSFRPAVAGSTFAHAPEKLRLARVSLYDEYHVNGLVLTEDHDPYREFIEGYATMMYLTLGLAEMFYLPYITIDLAKHAREHFELQLWYDRDDHLIAEEERPEPPSPEAARPTQKAHP